MRTGRRQKRSTRACALAGAKSRATRCDAPRVPGRVIALVKDVPDVPGDRQFGIRSFSVRAGQATVLRLAVAMRMAIFGAAALGLACAASAAQSALGVARRLTLAAGSLAAAVAVWRRSASVPAESSREVYRLYMFLWLTFYGAYFCLPFAR